MNIDVLNINCKIQEYQNSQIMTHEVFINEKKVNGYVAISGFFYDTHLMSEEDFNWYLYSDKEFEQYNKSLKRFNGVLSSVYLDSCSCGEPGCSGFYNGVRVYKKKKNYVYITRKKYGYSKGILETGKLQLCFSKENIIEQRKKVLEFIKNHKEILSENEYENNRYLYLLD